jgi:penicillin-binding protein 1C
MRPRPVWRLRGMRWLKRIALAVSIALTLCVLAAVAYVHAVPYPVAKLAPEASTSVVLTDRRGAVLRDFPLGTGGRAEWIALDRVPPELIQATMAGEDIRFFNHPGVDVVGVLRAALLAIGHGRFVSGASTITMQLVRMIDPHPKSLPEKLKEMLTALRLERVLSKRQILEQYVNRAYYGNGAFGVEAASRRYFDKSAAALGPGEAVLLAVLPRAPQGYDPRRHLDVALRRRAHVLDLMVQTGVLSRDERGRIEREPITLVHHEPVRAARHFVDYAMGELGQPRGGGVVRTTLDGVLQQRLEAVIADHIASERLHGLTQAGVVVLDPATGAVRAMVGSADYDAPDEGQNNILTTLRHPGSALKPFLYAMAIERGKTPASLAADSLAVLPDYHPHKAMREHGRSRFRESLAGSYNLAAVEVLRGLGVPAALERLRSLGLEPLAGTSADYGLDLALGSARVRLVDLAAAYGFLVNGGQVALPRVAEDQPIRHAMGSMSPEASWLVMDILSDPEARRAVFGADLPLDLPFKVAAKTGTSSGFADTVTVAATQEAVVAAWAGSFDGSGSKGRLAMWSAAPIVRAALLAVADVAGHALTLPTPPPGIVSRDVCRITGQLAGPGCPRKHEHFAAGQQPRTTCRAHAPGV